MEVNDDEEELYFIFLYGINYNSEEKYILMDLEGFGDSDLIEKFEKINIEVLMIKFLFLEI